MEKGTSSSPAGPSRSSRCSTAGRRTSPITRCVRALFKKSDGFEPVAAGFFDLAALPPAPQAVQRGLDGLKRFEIQWGIQDDAMLAVVGMVAPQPRRGLLAMLDQPTSRSIRSRHCPPG